MKTRKILPDEMESVDTEWSCDCGEWARGCVLDIFYNGTPQCPECDEDMELVCMSVPLHV